MPVPPCPRRVAPRGAPRRGRAVRACTLLRLIALLCGSLPGAQQLDLPEPRNVAPGVLLYHLDSPSLVDPEGPISIWALRLDPTRVDLQAALANDEIMGVETVGGIAERHKPIAAINAGFFLPNGDPAGVMTIDGRLVSDTRRPRGAVGISRDKAGVKLVFARLRATASLVLQNKIAVEQRRPGDGRRSRSTASTRRGCAAS